MSSAWMRVTIEKKSVTISQKCYPDDVESFDRALQKANEPTALSTVPDVSQERIELLLSPASSQSSPCTPKTTEVYRVLDGLSHMRKIVTHFSDF